MNLEHGQTLLFTGDSITDCGRERPLGERAGLGNGYVALVNSLLDAWYPQRRIRVLNTGISGNRVDHLEARWQTDILDHRPDWLSIMIGINDVWRHFDYANNPDQVDNGRYQTTYRNLLEQTRPQLKGLVLMTPYYIEANATDPMRAKMDQYSSVVEKLAGEFDAVFVNVQAAYDHYLAFRPTQSLCGDRVHPNQSGHMIIAKAFLTAVGFDWNTT
ncbi:MAG: SGNH/GDSL hydrolase family protein [Anaerolineae bacterium]|nr:SGNH/GDSL hydrolase family protein [Anaerolineae bacterium]